ncbi:MAG TPA: SLC13 family permease [Vicinamibacterales bacterium]|nr:SLC13 family permease [Vicinamibacterales bacterium]
MSATVVESQPITPASHWPRRALAGAAGFLALGVVWWLPLDASPAARHALAISVATIVWWATRPFDHAWVGLGALALFWIAGCSPPVTILSGFWNNTTGFLLGALAIGAFVSTTGLARRIAYSIAARLGSSYSGLLLALLCVDFLLTFLIPSGIARVAVLSSIVVGMAEALGLTRRDAAARGLMIAVTCAASTFDKMVLAGTSSILAAGIIEQIGGVRISYGLWFLAFVPCVLLTIVGCWQLVLWLFPDRSGAFPAGQHYFRSSLASLGPVSSHERRAMILAGSAIALWLTDRLHGLEPSTVALTVAAIALLPGIGVLSLRDLARLPFRTLIFTATALSMSAVLGHTGALQLLTGSTVQWMSALIQGPASAAFVLYWAAFGYHLLLGAQNLLVATTLPPVVTFGQSIGFSPEVVGMVWIFGTAGKVFPYQSGVLMVGYSHGYFDERDLLKLGFLLAVLESAILLLIVPMYWPLIGLS